MELGTRVQFNNWDRSKRTLEELEQLNSLKLTTGRVVRMEGSERAIIRWEAGELDLGLATGSFKFEGMGFLGQHYVSEIVETSPEIIEEVKASEIKVVREGLDDKHEEHVQLEKHPLTTVVSKEEKREFLNVAKFRFEPAKKTFINPMGQELDAEKVNNLFKQWLIKKILFERLESMIKVDGDHAANQNGVGFNQFDSSFAHSLFDNWFKYNHNWTGGQVAALAKTLFKYKSQIKLRMGENYRPIYDSLGLFEQIYTDQKEEMENTNVA